MYCRTQYIRRAAGAGLVDGGRLPGRGRVVSFVISLGSPEGVTGRG